VTLFFSIFAWWLLEVKEGPNQLVSPAESTVSARNPAECTVKLAQVFCDEEAEDIGNNFERQLDQSLVLIKSILITMERDGCVTYNHHHQQAEAL